MVYGVKKQSDKTFQILNCRSNRRQTITTEGGGTRVTLKSEPPIQGRGVLRSKAVIQLQTGPMSVFEFTYWTIGELELRGQFFLLGWNTYHDGGHWVREGEGAVRKGPRSSANPKAKTRFLV